MLLHLGDINMTVLAQATFSIGELKQSITQQNMQVSCFLYVSFLLKLWIIDRIYNLQFEVKFSIGTVKSPISCFC